jgi:hypothetical protein
LTSTTSQRLNSNEKVLRDRVLIEDELPKDHRTSRNGTNANDDIDEPDDEGRFYEAGVDEDYAELLSLVDAAEDIKVRY